jgi:hypothetical protein
MPRLVYSAEQIDFVAQTYKHVSLPDTTAAFNVRFGMDKSISAIRALCKNWGITCGRTTGDLNRGKSKVFTSEQIQFMRDNYPIYSLVDLVTVFNDHFSSQFGINQIRAYIHNNGITSGRTGRFTPGSAAWNHGVTGYMGPNRTSFKKGNLSHNHRPLWSERIDKNGYIEISVPERNPHTGSHTRFKHKHVWIWEQANGPKPKSTAVIFKDGNNRNFNRDNLLLVTRKELLSMNLHGYSKFPDVLKPSILAIAKLEARAGVRTNPGRGRSRK